MIERVARYGEIERLEPFTEVFSRGDRGRDFLVVLEGTIEIYERDDDGGVRPLRAQARARVHRRARPLQRPRDPR